VSHPDLDWQDDAACYGIEDRSIFFPGRGESSDPAKKVCAGCPVREECLNYAEVNLLKYGVWGGLSERQRRIRRKGRQMACETCGTEIPVSPRGRWCKPCGREAERVRMAARYKNRAAIERRTA
jgi:hypothetical protein